MFTTLKDWFDLELKPFTGIDVYKTQFPHDRGYAIYENRFARVLVYRFEALHNLAEFLGEFMRCKINSLANRNLGASKPYAEQYRSVKESLRLPAGFVTDLYGCKMMRHFYSDQERLGWEKKWAEPSQALAQST